MVWLAFVMAVLYVCAGYALASFLSHRSKAGEHANDGGSSANAADAGMRIDPNEARELIRSLQELAASVDDDVDRHTSRVAHISSELNNPTADSAVVLAVAAKLIEANKQLQADLACAKREIQIQQHELDNYIAEARTDALTSLPNRRAFDQELARWYSQWERQGTPLSLLLIDVDHFKTFNDLHGHPAGDAVLQGVAHLLAETVRKIDLVARYGGEEFAIILPGASVSEAKPTAERIREAIAEKPFDVEGEQLQVTVSVGLAELMDRDSAAMLIKRADAALYAAKNGGRNGGWLHDGKECIPITTDRRPVANRVQRIAPFVDGLFPERDMFRDVECFDVSSTGFSYLVTEPPGYDSVLVAIHKKRHQKAGERAYRWASIDDWSNIGTPAEPLFRVECCYTVPSLDADLQNEPEGDEFELPTGEDAETVESRH